MALSSTALAQIRDKKPLILCLTNTVTMDIMGNSLLALGAAPIMSQHDDEMEELIQIAGAINLNIGTLTPEFIARCHKILPIAQHYQVPIILDPVGAGASQIRTQLARLLLPHITTVRGNASEIKALLEPTQKSLGVESLLQTDEVISYAKTLAVEYNLVVAISGAEDFITDGKQEIRSHLGSAMMPYVTGMGCTLTAIIAAFHATLPDPLEATHTAIHLMGVCGKIAETSSGKKPASFRTAFIDTLYSIEDLSLGEYYAK